MMNRHDTSPLTAEEQHPHRGEWLRDIVFGLNDGLVTTLVFIMVVNGVAAGRVVLVALGEVIAGGLSMALGATSPPRPRPISATTASPWSVTRFGTSRTRSVPSYATCIVARDSAAACWTASWTI